MRRAHHYTMHIDLRIADLSTPEVQAWYERLHLETGTGPAFAAAHALYLRNGFQWSGPFGGYTATHFNVFTELAL